MDDWFWFTLWLITECSVAIFTESKTEQTSRVCRVSFKIRRRGHINPVIIFPIVVENRLF